MGDQSKPRLIIRTPLRKRNENCHGVPLETCTITRCLSLHAIHGSTIHLRQAWIYLHSEAKAKVMNQEPRINEN
jgi:hypothetical protein